MRTVAAKICVLISVLLALVRTHAACPELTIGAFDKGWYDSLGYHAAHNENYIVGDGTSEAGPLRNWFAFNIPTISEPIVSASLRVFTFRIAAPGGSETYQLRHVGTPVSTLRAPSNPSTSIYADLADGTIYGSRVISTNEENQWVTIPLNAACVANLESAKGGAFAMGGEVTTLNPLSETEYLFGFSGTGVGAELVLNLATGEDLLLFREPQSQTVPAGQSPVYFLAEACGTSAVSYQWQFNSTNISGATTPILTLLNVSSNDAGNYRVVVTNLSGALTSAVATLTVYYAPPTATAYVAFGASPAYTGQYIRLCANVDGVPFPAVQWRLNGVDLPGAQNTCLEFPNIQTNSGGDYTIVASNAVGVLTSAVVRLEVTNAPPVYAYMPFGPGPIAVGSYAYICAVTDLSPFPGFQWRFNGVDLPNQNSQCLYVFNLNTNHAGFYTVVATNSSGSYTSPPIELTVYYQPPSPPYFYFPLGNPNALVGNDVTICASVGGSPPLQYQWRFNGVDLPGENASCLSLVEVSTNQAGSYSLVVSNVAGMVTSSVVFVTVDYREPIFIAQPFGQTVVEGATLRVPGYAPAGPPATHVLQQNGTNVPVPFTFDQFGGGGFTLLDVTLADAGEYRVIASNAFGVVTSQVATLTVTPATPLDKWTQRNPLPQSQFLFSLTYGNGLFVGVGDRGTVLTSPDGTNWTVQRRRVDLALRGVAYGDGVFVAVGDAGTILSSIDGTNWSYRYTATFPLNAITYGNGTFAVVGGTGQTFVLLSTNGVEWERLPVPAVYADRGIAFGNGAFVAVGPSAIITSADARDWVVTLSPLNDLLEHVSFEQGQFIAVGNGGIMLVSGNGSNWTPRNSGTTRRLLGVTYGNGQFVSVGVRGNIFTSTNNVDWVAATSGTPDRLETVFFANGLFIAAGENGTTLTSTNGMAWAKQNQGTTRDLDGMVVVNGLIVVAGKAGTILTSTNGRHYAPQNASVTNDLHGVAWGNGLFVAVGEPGIIITSPDATNWTSRVTDNTNSLKGATYGNGMWVVVGTGGAVITSTDGENWTAAITSPPYDLNDVAYGNDRFIIAGDGQNSINGSAFFSSNGVNWVWVNYPFEKNLRSILFTNGFFFVTANDSRLFLSTNGLTWVPQFAPSFGNLRGATLAHGLWTVVGNRGYIGTSTNLTNWSIRPTRTFENLHDVVYLDGKLVTIGNRGTILQSERFITELEPPVYHPSAGATVVMKGILGEAYDFAATTNFVQWDLLRRFTNITERVVFTDSNAVAHPHRFYRATPTPGP